MPGPNILVSPSVLSFGLAITNTSITNSYTVQNIGSGILTGSVSVLPPFYVTSNFVYNLSSNQSQTVWIKYNPFQVNFDTNTLNFNGNSSSSVQALGQSTIIQPSLTFGSCAGTISYPFTTNISCVTSQAIQTDWTSGGVVIYSFNITNISAGYYISNNASAPNGSANSVYIGIDTIPNSAGYEWNMPITTGFSNIVVTLESSGGIGHPMKFNFGSTGIHNMYVIGRESGALLGQWTIVQESTPVKPTPPTFFRVLTL